MFDTVLQPFLEKLSGRIAVSPAARKVIVEHLGARRGGHPERRGGRALRRRADPLPGYPREGGDDRLHRPLRRAAQGHGRAGRRARAAGRRPPASCGCSSPGGARPRSSSAGCRRRSRDRIELLGQVSEADKARMLRSVDVYCAPNTGQESFGVILLEAMAARTPIVASDLEAFRRCWATARPASCSPTGDAGRPGPRRWPTCSTTRRARRRWPPRAPRAVAPYDWAVVVAGRAARLRAGDRRSGSCRTEPVQGVVPRHGPRG